MAAAGAHPTGTTDVRSLLMLHPRALLMRTSFAINVAAQAGFSLMIRGKEGSKAGDEIYIYNRGRSFFFR